MSINNDQFYETLNTILNSSNSDKDVFLSDFINQVCKPTTIKVLFNRFCSVLVHDLITLTDFTTQRELGFDFVNYKHPCIDKLKQVEKIKIDFQFKKFVDYLNRITLHVKYNLFPIKLYPRFKELSSDFQTQILSLAKFKFSQSISEYFSSPTLEYYTTDQLLKYLTSQQLIVNNIPKVYEHLYNCILSSNIEGILTLIDHNVDLNTTYEDTGNTAIMYAAQSNSIEAVKILIKNNVRLDLINSDEMDALLMATSNGNFEILEMLIQSGSSNILKSEGQKALFMASELGHIECVKLLVENGVNMDYVDFDGNTALTFACQSTESDCFFYLVEKGANINLVDIMGTSCLHYVSRNKDYHNHLKMCLALIQRGVDINVIDYISWVSPIFHFVSQESLESLPLLLALGADINILDNQNNNILYYAITQGNLPIFKLLVEHFRNINFSHLTSPTLIFAVNSSVNNCMITELIESGAQIDILDTNGNTPLLLASQHNYTQTCKILIKYGANVNHQNRDGNTALHFAAERGNEKLVKKLLKNKAQINIQDSKGDTPLTVAVRNNYTSIVQMLVEFGAV